MSTPSQIRTPTAIGWQEMVGLPTFDTLLMRAKIDTGAQASALHAVDIEAIERDGKRCVRFSLPFLEGAAVRRFTEPLLDQRPIKNTSGVPEDRMIIQTSLFLGRRRWRIELSLADRANMGFELILGRTIPPTSPPGRTSQHLKALWTARLTSRPWPCATTGLRRLTNRSSCCGGSRRATGPALPKPVQSWTP